MNVRISADPKRFTPVESNYGVLNFFKDCEDYLYSHDGCKNVLEAVSNSFDWVLYFNKNQSAAKAVKRITDPGTRMFSVFNLVEHLNGLRDGFRIKDRNIAKVQENTFRHLVLGVASAAETACFFHELGVYVIKQGINTVKTTRWTAVGIFDTVNVYNKAERILALKEELNREKVPEKKKILRDKIKLTYFQMLEKTTVVVMSIISLVSLVFANIAQGFLFNPSVPLFLSSCWLALNISNHFFKKAIEYREHQLDELAKMQARPFLLLDQKDSWLDNLKQKIHKLAKS